MSFLNDLQSMSQPLMQQMGPLMNANGLNPAEMKDLEGLKSGAQKMFQSVSNNPNVRQALKGLTETELGPSIQKTTSLSHSSRAPNFEKVLSTALNAVDQKEKTALSQVNSVLLGKSDNLPQAILAMRERGLAFNLLVEIRNQLMQGAQELLRLNI